MEEEERELEDGALDREVKQKSKQLSSFRLCMLRFVCRVVLVSVENGLGY